MPTYNDPVPPGFSTGLIPRDFTAYPQGCYAWAPPFPDDQLIPQSEWADRLAENRATKSGLLDLRNAHYDILKSLNQNGKGLCWAFSSTKACMYLRILGNLPGEILSAWWVAGKIKGWRDQGGWGSASLDYIIEHGVPKMDLCPGYSSKYDTQECRDNAGLHKVTEWWDGAENSSQAQKQLVSSLLLRKPCVVDLNVMSHSMCAIDLESVNPVTVIYDNSWGEGNDRGLYRGKGAYASPNGLSIPRVVMA